MIRNSNKTSKTLLEEKERKFTVNISKSSVELWTKFEY